MKLFILACPLFLETNIVMALLVCPSDSTTLFFYLQMKNKQYAITAEDKHDS
jgi:uncharacterized protein YbaR (Trm112 family)